MKARAALLLTVALLAGLSAATLDRRARAFAAWSLAERSLVAPRLSPPAGAILPVATLAGWTADRAAAAGVRLSARPVPDFAPGAVAVDLDAEAPEAALRGFARALESDRPLVRLVRWSIRPAGPDRFRLEGRAVAIASLSR